jgi:hypothetical protein
MMKSDAGGGGRRSPRLDTIHELARWLGWVVCFKWDGHGSECLIPGGHLLLGVIRFSRTRAACSFGWWLVLICSERKVRLADCWWLIGSERKTLLTGDWWLDSKSDSRSIPTAALPNSNSTIPSSILFPASWSHSGNATVNSKRPSIQWDWDSQPDFFALSPPYPSWIHCGPTLPGMSVVCKFSQGKIHILLMIKLMYKMLVRCVVKKWHWIGGWM